MYFVRPLIARTMVWLAAVATPLQGLPTASCGCTAGSDTVVATMKADTATSCCKKSTRACPCTGASICRCGEGSRCSQSNARSCCSSANGGHASAQASCCRTCSCCCCGGDSGGAGCSCGDNCRCSESEPPTNPATPPVEDSQPDRVLVASSMPVALNDALPIVPRASRLDIAAMAASLPTVDRCVSLCRFTL